MRSIVILILFSAILFSIGLGNMPLTDPDEVFYAETAREMLNRGELLTPYIFGKPQFEKPALYYWLVLFSFKAFGVNEFSARIASSLLGILGVIGIYLLGTTLINKRVGFLSGIVLATSIKYIILSKACVTDIALTVFILYGFLFFFQRRYLLSAAALGLAVLTKGPIGIFLPVIIIGIYLILAKEFKILKKIPFLRGTVVFLAVAAPWYLLMYKTHGSAFIDGFFGFHNIIRFLHPEHKIGDVFYYYFPVLLGGFFPWSMILPLGAWQILREKEERIKKASLFSSIWILVIFIFFSMSRTKLATYIFPLYPALALLVARFLYVLLDKGVTQKMKKTMSFMLCLFFAALFGGLIVLYVISKAKYPTITNTSVIAGMVFIPLMLVFVAAFLKEKYKASLSVFMAFFISFVFVAYVFILPEIGRYESSKEISQELLRLAKPGEAFGAETDYTRGVAFYTDREDIPDVHRHHIITEFLKRKDRVWAVIKIKNYNQIYDDETRFFDKRTYVMYELGKKLIATNKIMPGEKFIRARGNR